MHTVCKGKKKETVVQILIYALQHLNYFLP